MMNALKLFADHLKNLRGTKSTSERKRICNIVEEFSRWCTQNALDDDFEKITGRDIESYLQVCWSRGIGGPRRLYRLYVLKKFFRFLVNASVVKNDPTADVNRPDPNSDLALAFSHDEILRLFAEIDPSTEKGLRDIVFLIMGAFAGLRLNEIVRFNISGVMDDGKHIGLHLMNHRNVSRVVSLWEAPSEIVRSLLRARLAQGAGKEDPLLVSYLKSGRPRGNRRLTNDACDDIIKKLAKHAGIRKPMISTHVLRLTHVRDLMLIETYDTAAIMKRLGWVQPNYSMVHRIKSYQKYQSLPAYWADFGELPIVESFRSRMRSSR